ncbi:MAG TPA: DNA polymerase III subunit gamma/tau [Methylomirabilota bacterium]|nr:DNA polymerase III subunit gamma/tau [Methylomirabilota bacterium]
MSYQVLARKWRPQTFDAVVGQDAITRTLRNALASGRIAHAYLFAGPRGIGKTTTARLLARALLCTARTGPEPCGKCAICVEGLAGTLVDVIEIDGASNRGIEEIRTLRENVKYTPARGKYKVYIIDEVHQLTEAAFNALLKTLEEPPPHIVFVLATTDPRDIPPTVLSRVQRFDFRPIAPDALRASLEHILNEEKIKFEPAALPVIVRAAEGSLRDALSLLDTAIAYGEGRLEAETTAKLLGATAPVTVRAFATAVVGYDTAAALEAVDRAARDGEDLLAFTRDVIEILRLTLVLKAAPNAKPADLTHTEGNELRKLGEGTSLDEILYVLRAFLEADALMRESPHPRVELEIATVRATRRPVPQALDDVLRRVDEAQREMRQQALASPAAPAPAAQASLLPGAEPAPVRADVRRPGATAPSSSSPSAPPSSPPPAPRAAASQPAATPTAPAQRPSASTPPSAAPTAVAAPPSPAAAPLSQDLATAWERVVEEVMKRKPTLGGVLTQARPSGVVDRELTIVLHGNHFHREMLADVTNRELVVQAVRRCVAGAERVNVVSGGDAGGTIATHPAVQAAIAEFQGEVVAVRPRLPEGEGQ